MKRKNWKYYVFWILLSLGTGTLSGWLIRNSVSLYNAQIRKPPLSPPPEVFPVVWTILYLLMGIGAAMIAMSASSPERSRSLNLFVLQLLLNYLWSPVFFNRQLFGTALIILAILWVLVLWMILSFYLVRPVSALLQIPYLLWLTFAAYLNFGVWYLNP